MDLKQLNKTQEVLKLALPKERGILGRWISIKDKIFSGFFSSLFKNSSSSQAKAVASIANLEGVATSSAETVAKTAVPILKPELPGSVVNQAVAKAEEVVLKINKQIKELFIMKILIELEKHDLIKNKKIKIDDLCNLEYKTKKTGHDDEISIKIPLEESLFKFEAVVRPQSGPGYIFVKPVKLTRLAD